MSGIPGVMNFFDPEITDPNFLVNALINYLSIGYIEFNTFVSSHLLEVLVYFMLLPLLKIKFARRWDD